MEITAAVSRERGRVALEQLELGEPRADEVLVKILSAGICRTDLEALDGTIPVPRPVVLGHEGAGIVEKVGSAVTTVRVGDTVILGAAACGTCRMCRVGKYPYCVNHTAVNFAASRPDGSSALSDATGETVNGHFFSQSSWSSHAIAHQSNAIPVPAGTDASLLGPFGCGVLTGAATVLRVLDIQAGTSIAVFGLGAVGLSAVMGAALAGATTIIAVDRGPSRFDVARDLGATHTIDTSVDDVVEVIHRITDGTGVGYSFEATGSTAIMKTAVDVMEETGHAALVGAAPPGSTFELDVWKVLKGRVVQGSVMGDIAPIEMLPRLVELHRQGRLPVERIVATYPLEDIDRAIADMNAGRVIKPVLIPSHR